MIRVGCCAQITDYIAVKEAGFDVIELPGNQIVALTSQEFDDFLEKVKTSQLECYAFNAAFPEQVRICGPNFNLEAAREYMKLLCKRGSALGISSIGVGSPSSRTLPSGYDKKLAWEQTLTFLAALCEEAAPFGISILWESLNQTETNFGLSMPLAAKKIEMLRKDGCDNLWMIADLYHMSLVGETPQDLIDCLPLIRHIHIAQRVGSQRRYPSWEYAHNYVAQLKPVLKYGYDGVISMEAFDGRVESDGKAALKLIRQLIQNCNVLV